MAIIAHAFSLSAGTSQRGLAVRRVESLVERINEQIADSTNEVSHMINQMNEIMAECNAETTLKCKLMIDKLESLRKRTKKLKRPRKFHEDEIQ